MERRRRGEDQRVYLELRSARDWYDHIESQVAPYFKGARRALKQCIQAKRHEALLLPRNNRDGWAARTSSLFFETEAVLTRLTAKAGGHSVSILTTEFLRDTCRCVFVNEHEGSPAETKYFGFQKAVLQHPSKARDQVSTGAPRSHTSQLSRFVKVTRPNI